MSIPGGEGHGSSWRVSRCSLSASWTAGSACSTYVSIRQHTSAYVSILSASWTAGSASSAQRCLNLYFCTSKARKFGIHLVPNFVPDVYLHALLAAFRVSIRQHTSAYDHYLLCTCMLSLPPLESAYVSIRQHTSAYHHYLLCTCMLSLPPLESGTIAASSSDICRAYVSIRQHTSAYVSILIRHLKSIRSSLHQHTHGAFVGIRQHT